MLNWLASPHQVQKLIWSCSVISLIPYLLSWPFYKPKAALLRLDLYNIFDLALFISTNLLLGISLSLYYILKYKDHKLVPRPYLEKYFKVAYAQEPWPVLGSETLWDNLCPKNNQYSINTFLAQAQQNVLICYESGCFKADGLHCNKLISHCAPSCAVIYRHLKMHVFMLPLWNTCTVTPAQASSARYQICTRSTLTVRNQSFY